MNGIHASCWGSFPWAATHFPYPFRVASTTANCVSARINGVDVFIKFSTGKILVTSYVIKSVGLPLKGATPS